MTRPATRTEASLRVKRSNATAFQRQVQFVWLCQANQVPPCVLEHRFHPTRKWRFDFAWPDVKVALESEGGAWVQGAHGRGKHFAADAEKYNEAALAGWLVVRVLSGQLVSTATVALVKRALGARRAA